eukprot:TRINITY_DN15037_c0_g1_i1.p1 TRINITY_DN15037_c0_g1~~TRINITY_DN15037_c0_g1_i1.p1  ORF type:complete len:313 (-),score=40.58 TRINITY_DN15037_c0_g1_i1:3-902(-)
MAESAFAELSLKGIDPLKEYILKPLRWTGTLSALPCVSKRFRTTFSTIINQIEPLHERIFVSQKLWTKGQRRNKNNLYNPFVVAESDFLDNIHKLFLKKRSFSSLSGGLILSECLDQFTKSSFPIESRVINGRCWLINRMLFPSVTWESFAKKTFLKTVVQSSLTTPVLAKRKLGIESSELARSKFQHHTTSDLPQKRKIETNVDQEILLGVSVDSLNQIGFENERKNDRSSFITALEYYDAVQLLNSTQSQSPASQPSLPNDDLMDSHFDDKSSALIQDRSPMRYNSEDFSPYSLNEE